MEREKERDITREREKDRERDVRKFTKKCWGGGMLLAVRANLIFEGQKKAAVLNCGKSRRW